MPRLIITPRILCTLAFTASVLVCLVGYFLEAYYQLNPCPLCLMQRGLFMWIGGLFLISICRIRFMRTMLHSVIVFSIFGLILAGRQVWLQHQPIPAISSCSAGLETLLKLYSPFEALKTFFEGTSSCHQIDFQLFHLTLAEWSGLLFLSFILFCYYTLRYQKRLRS